MDAEQARKISNAQAQGPAIKKYVDHIESRISTAAMKGKSSILNPHVGTREQGFDFYLNQNELKAVQRYFISKGFDWTEHPDPDPGHPCSSPYQTLSW